MDADLQDSPDEIIPMYNMLLSKSVTLSQVGRRSLYDNAIIKIFLPNFTIPSLVGWGVNFTTWIVRTQSLSIRSAGRALKCSERCTDIFRWLQSGGFFRNGEKVVQHKVRKYGHSKFGMTFLYGFWTFHNHVYRKFGKKGRCTFLVY